jgi:hypothetical protein
MQVTIIMYTIVKAHMQCSGRLTHNCMPGSGLWWETLVPAGKS